MVMVVCEEESQKPHVALLSSPGIGHVTPILELAKRLVVDHGFQVSFLAITTDAPPAQLQLLNNNPTLPSDLHVIHLPHVDVACGDHVSIRLVHIVRESLRSLPSVLTSLQSLKPPLKALIVDPFCMEALEIAADHSVPTYLFLTASASFLALAIYFPMLHAEVEGDYGKIGERVFVPGCKPLWVDDLLPDVLMPEVLPLCNRIPLVKGIFVNTWEELEPVALSAFKNHPFFVNLPTPTVHPIGPLTKNEDAGVESELLTWLDKQPRDSVVYVSFGSGGTLSAEQLAELAHGLERSAKRFLWVARPPKANDASGSFFETGSDGALAASYLPDGFLERTQGAGLLTVSWAPQVAVLSHPSVCGFVTHCGWNSVMESVVHGVAMVAWPLYAEQKMNARALVEMGVAVRPEVGEEGLVGRKEVERVMRMVVEGEEGKEIRRRVREVQGSAVEALGCGGSSSECLNRLGKEWRAG